MKTTNDSILQSVNTLTAEGKSTKEIAEALNIAERTVRNYKAMKPIVLKPYMHPRNKIDFTYENRVITILQGKPKPSKYWLIRAYTTGPVAAAIFLTTHEAVVLDDLPDKTKCFEVLEFDKKDWDEPNS